MDKSLKGGINHFGLILAAAEVKYIHNFILFIIIILLLLLLNILYFYFIMWIENFPKLYLAKLKNIQF